MSAIISPELNQFREADAATLKRAGVRLGETYSRPIVEHGAARSRALAAGERVKKS